MKDRLFLCIIGAVFALVGCGILAKSALDLRKQAAIQHWPEHTATITHCNIRSSDKSISLTATFAYEIDGTPHTSTRLRLFDGGTESSYRQRYDQLREAKNNRTPLPCRVNPANPADAILDPAFHTIHFLILTLPFGFLFTAVGITVILFGYHHKRPPAQASTRARFWRGIATTLATASLLYTLILATQLLAIHPLPWHVWFVATPALLLTAWAAYLWFFTSKFGHATLHTSLLRDGHREILTGSLRLSKPLHTHSPVTLTLRWHERTTTRSGNKTTIQTHEHWRLATQATPSNYGTETILNFRFPLPSHAPSTSPDPTADSYHFWKLTIHADCPGLDYRASFNPHIQRALTPASTEPDPEPLPDFQTHHELLHFYQTQTRIRITTTPEGVTRIHFPAPLNPAYTLFLGVLSAIFTAATFFMIFAKAPLLFPIIFAPVSLLLLLGFLKSLLLSSTLLLDRPARAATLTRSLAGLPLKRLTLPFTAISDLTSKTTLTVGNVPYPDLLLLDTHGKRHLIVPHIRQTWRPDQLLAWLKSQTQ